MRKMVATVTLAYYVDESDYPGEFRKGDKTLTRDEAIISLETGRLRNCVESAIADKYDGSDGTGIMAIQDISVKYA